MQKSENTMRNDRSFDLNSFTCPDVSCAPVYIWVWNDVCTRGIIDSQLSEMQRLGIRAFYILPEPKGFRPRSMPTNLEPDYLSADYFGLCAYAIQVGSARGMRCWIYDEGGWPSGGACGKVLRDHPEFARQALKARERAFSAGDVYRKPSPEILAAFLDDRDMIPDGYRFTADAVVTEYTAEKEICGDADYPDLLNKDATAYFLHVTHEQYAHALGDALGRSVTAVFTDEPKAPGRAFNEAIAQRYETLYAESVLPYLPLLAQRTAPTPENAHVLVRWYDLCSRLFCEHFLLPCKEWANAHGMAFTGHMDKDHDPLGCIRGGRNFNLMRALRCMDIPGVDVIWRQIYPADRTDKRDDMNAYNGFYPRYASSAAAQNGTTRAMSESFGVTGPGMPYALMRFIVGYQAVRGINVFNFFNFPLGRRGALLAQELPVFTEKQPQNRELARFNRYVERLCYVYTRGERVCETGLYMPVRDFHSGLHASCTAEEFDALGRALEERLIDFDIVDDDVIQAAEGADDGCLRMGSAVYRHILIPGSAEVPQDTQKVLDRFIRSGGSVSCSLTGLSPELQIEGTGLRAMRRKTDNAELICLFRESGDSEAFSIRLPSRGGYLEDLRNGALQRFRTEDGVLRLSLTVGETAVILLTDEALCADAVKDFGNRLNIAGGFLFRRAEEQTCDENGFGTVLHTDEAVPVRLGDWAAYVGEAYSGSGVYETAFPVPPGMIGQEGVLDLGEVHDTAAVCLNGRPLGTVLAPPYRVSVPAGLLRAQNSLKVVVTNTDANWYASTDYFDQWQTNELSPYFAGERDYAKAYAAGGLYGPVSLCTE